MEQKNIPDELNLGLVRYASYASVAVASFLILIKLGAYLATHSVVLLASLIDSLLDVAASFINLIAIRHALVPADDEHRFGHGKAEPIAGLAQAAFIAGSALFLIVESGNRLFHPLMIKHGTLGIVVMIISTISTVGLVYYQRYVIKKTGSIAIKADSLHYLGDVLVNLSIIVALVLSIYLEWYIADPLFALGVAAYVLYNAWEIVKGAMDQLMDRELPDEERNRITEIARRHPEVHDIHELRTRTSGYIRFIQMHLEMDPLLTLQKAHQISDEVEAEIHKSFPNSEVIIHEDPASREDKLEK
jgi:ferrous-iron efflux pump FieF